jgi:acrylyl-CoA reductase (NADPH)
LILNNGAKLVKEYPHIPGIDFSGTVVASESEKFKKDDQVILTGWRVGEIFYGGFSQYAKVNSDFLVKKPSNISSKDAMIMGTAGVTALLCSFAIKAREELLLGEKVNDVLVTGASGGVGSIAVMILAKFGYNVTAVTGKKSNEEYLKSLGAKNIINKEELDKDSRPLDKGLWDGVVDTVGGKILATCLAQTKDNGIVAACGNASDYKLNTTVMPFIIRGVKLWGINSVNTSIKRREFVWNEVSSLIDFKKLEQSIKIISLEDLLEIYSKMLKGETSGRYIIDVNK